MFLSGLPGYYAAYALLSACVFLVFRHKLREWNSRGTLLYILAILIGGLTPFAVQLLGTWAALAVLVVSAVAIAAWLTVVMDKTALEETEAEPTLIEEEASRQQQEDQEEPITVAADLFTDQVEVEEENSPAEQEIAPYEDMELLSADELWAEAAVAEETVDLPEPDPVVPEQSEQMEQTDSMDEEIVYRFDDEELLPDDSSTGDWEEPLVFDLEEAEEPLISVVEEAEEPLVFELEKAEEPLVTEVVEAEESLEAEVEEAEESTHAVFTPEQQALVQLHYQTAREALRTSNYTAALPELTKALQYPVPAISRMIMTADYVAILQALGLYEQAVQVWEQTLEKLSQSSSDPEQLQRFAADIRNRTAYLGILSQLLREQQKPNLPWPLVTEEIRQEAEARFAEWKAANGMN